MVKIIFSLVIAMNPCLREINISDKEEIINFCKEVKKIDVKTHLKDYQLLKMLIVVILKIFLMNLNKQRIFKTLNHIL